MFCDATVNAGFAACGCVRLFYNSVAVAKSLLGVCTRIHNKSTRLVAPVHVGTPHVCFADAHVASPLMESHCATKSECLPQDGGEEFDRWMLGQGRRCVLECVCVRANAPTRFHTTLPLACAVAPPATTTSCSTARGGAACQMKTTTKLEFVTRNAALAGGLTAHQFVEGAVLTGTDGM